MEDPQVRAKLEQLNLETRRKVIEGLGGREEADYVGLPAAATTSPEADLAAQ